MRRFLAFAVLLACSLPVGLSLAGCGHNPNNYCVKNGHAYGPTTSQVAYVTLGPELTGVSLTWGQTGTLGAPQAYNCNGGSESVGSYTYASSNLLLADVSPSGQVCGGTWNRNSPGGTPNFTICTPPSGSSLNSFSGCTGSTCGVVQLTATGAGVTSNPVYVYVHPPITSITIPAQAACVSQNATLPTSLLAETTVSGPGGVTLCCPPGTTGCTAAVPACTAQNANIGTIQYGAVNASVVNIENTTNPSSTASNPVTGGTGSNPNPNGIATAALPGSTVINATSSDVTSAAGYFSTCPPTNIKLTINGSTSATVTPSSPQTAVATAVDQNNHVITGLPLSYASTEPQNLNVSSTGLITNTFPSHATVSAICTPPGCNPAPVNLIGLLGNGMPVTANNVTVNAGGRSTNQVWMASSKSPFFSEVDLSTGGKAAPVRLPYTPNSMVMDQSGDTLYFGSYHELMIYGALGNALSKEVPGVPGLVLAVSPTNTSVVINDQLRQVIYLYSTNSGTYTSVAGIANHAQYSPDGTTVYITGKDPATGQNTLFVNNSSSGWSTYPITSQPAFNCPLDAAGTAAVPAYNPQFDPYCGPAVTTTVPSAVAFLTGNSTAMRSFCPNAANPNAPPDYFPPAGDVTAVTTQLTATADGLHVLGASPTSFTDILLGPDGSGKPAGVPTGACPAYAGTPFTLTTSPKTMSLTNLFTAPVAVSEIDQVVSSPDSSLAFITYNNNTPTAGSGELPYYQPLASGAVGTTGTIQLSAGAVAPVAGIFSPDGTIFFVSTSGDDLVHFINTGTLTDSQTINPKLTDGNGNAVPAEFLAVKSRSTT